jgi:hypothetical protein
LSQVQQRMLPDRLAQTATNGLSMKGLTTSELLIQVPIGKFGRTIEVK